jgi:hypothetical protein
MSVELLQVACMPNIEEYTTIQAAANDRRVPYTAYWLRRLAQQGKIEAVKVGEGARGQWLVHLPSLLEYIKEMSDLGTQKHNPHD